MHVFETLSILALGATLAQAAAVPGTSPANTKLVRRNGCYSSGMRQDLYLKFEDLHGSKRTDNSEVSSDITTTCKMVEGKTFAPGEVWTRCSSWEKVVTDDCEGNCLDSCGGTNTFPGSTALADQMSQGLCAASCTRCDGVEAKITETGWNHIDWEIKNEGGFDATLSFDACSAALNTELGGCDSGSEQSHDGFWYRIDPNIDGCPA